MGGPGTKTFHEQFADGIKELGQLCAHLDEIIKSMETAAKAYDYYDGKVRDVVDAVRI